MSKLIFYFFAIIFFVLLFNLVCTAPKAPVKAKGPVLIAPPKTPATIGKNLVMKTTGTDEEEDDDDAAGDEDDDASPTEEEEGNEIVYDEPIETKKKPAIMFRKSNGIRITSRYMDSFLIIGLTLSISSL